MLHNNIKEMDNNKDSMCTSSMATSLFTIVGTILFTRVLSLYYPPSSIFLIQTQYWRVQYQVGPNSNLAFHSSVQNQVSYIYWIWSCLVVIIVELCVFLQPLFGNEWQNNCERIDYITEKINTHCAQLKMKIAQW